MADDNYSFPKAAAPRTKSGVLDAKVLGALAALVAVDMARHGGFTLPGLAKMKVVKKAATKARKGINPFTKEPTIFKAKPARKLVKIRPLKALKDAVK